MPKHVDHEQRRELIADAVCRLASRNGLEGVSLRTVAAEAGISMGLVQHYFTTKAEMLLFAYQVMSERAGRRLRAAMAAAPQPLSTCALLRVLLLAMLPLDEESRFEAPLWVAFMAGAVSTPSLASPLQENGRQLATFVADQLRAARSAGEIAADVDPPLEALSLLAMVDGAMIQALIGPASTDAARAAVEHHLDRLFGR